jgi:hypothetical protein
MQHQYCWNNEGLEKALCDFPAAISAESTIPAGSSAAGSL